MKPYHACLPFDPRTLLKTPQTYVIKEMQGLGGQMGYYTHFGNLSGLTDLVQQHPVPSNGRLKLQFNFDGLPLSNVKWHGSLDSFSSFPFENKLKEVEQLVRKPGYPLAQIIRWVSENELHSEQTDLPVRMVHWQSWSIMKDQFQLDTRKLSSLFS